MHFSVHTPPQVEASSVPSDFDAVLSGFTREGLRVLALAQGEVTWVSPSIADCFFTLSTFLLFAYILPSDYAGLILLFFPFQAHSDQLAKWSMANVERAVPLKLVGLAVMANPVRPDSAQVIRKLQEASIRTVMVTGVYHQGYRLSTWPIHMVGTVLLIRPLLSPSQIYP